MRLSAISAAHMFLEERERAEMLHGDRATFHRVMRGDLAGAVAILTEEIGEVAKAANDGERQRMREELVQVMAVAYAMLDGLGA